MSKSTKYYSAKDNKRVHKAPPITQVSVYQEGGIKPSNKYGEKKSNVKKER